MVRALTAAAVLAGLTFNQAEAAPLTQIGSIPLGDAKGAIADLGMDYANQRLFILEPDAGTLAVVDLEGAKITQSITGLTGPRGLARAPTDNRLYVSTSDGKLMIYQGAPLKAEGSVEVGANPGMLHYDAGSERIYLGLGGRKIAIIDSTHNKHWDNIRLDAEPGPLALEDNGSRIFIGAAGEPRILVADRDGNKQTASWSTGPNGPAEAVALDEDGGRLLAAFRQPAAVAWFDLNDGSLKGTAPACAEPGQLLSDDNRHRVYLVCGDGKIQVFGRDAAGGYAAVGEVPTDKGAAAAFLVPTSGRLFLGVPAEAGHGAEIRIYAPAG
jgi:DNA-binding beta-propeller fold protein YncE